ncbi:hypothetical protein [Aestuariispira insulae]|uniref:Uncharacterized protein n=1 Tax=Aestuariispira insulae TaxID=1461337 RepID=A0A3D9H3T5_9PROT|nr:hypothetical protein [Aestuariispira insulae]RED44139.1 hypothetical protein DFP90_11743 [Aestuariispira insulae]
MKYSKDYSLTVSERQRICSEVATDIAIYLRYASGQYPNLNRIKATIYHLNDLLHNIPLFLVDESQEWVEGCFSAFYQRLSEREIEFVECSDLWENICTGVARYLGEPAQLGKRI